MTMISLRHTISTSSRQDPHNLDVPLKVSLSLLALLTLNSGMNSSRLYEQCIDHVRLRMKGSREFVHGPSQHVVPLHL